MTGTLYVVPTPIGNLDDITLRALRVLNEVDLIAAEDTRHSRPLVTHFGIATRLVSYHQHSKRSGIARILAALESGNVALISDAGMPSIADPGFELIGAAIERGFRVEVLPGASAVTTAVALAALAARGFIFMGFLPRGRSEMATALKAVAALPYSLVIFESPRRIAATARCIGETLGEREIVVTRELSKLHEQTYRGTVSHVGAQFSEHEPLGEFTIVVGPGREQPLAPTDDEVAGALARLSEEGETGRDAVRIVSEALEVPRSAVYRVWLSESKRGP